MFNNPYPIINLGGEKHVGKNPKESRYYKFKTPHRSYFVTLELFDFPLVAIKYCDLKDKNAKNRYRKIFNDCDAFRVIATCLYIMLEYWKKYPRVNFVFHAAPRHFIDKENVFNLTEEQLDSYSKVRYSIYRYAMLNYFSYDDFTHVSDRGSGIYILMNKQQSKASRVMDKVKNYLQRNHDIIFTPED